MSEGFVDTAATNDRDEDQRFYGVAIAQVINNHDVTGRARVQVRLPWLPQSEPWARVAMPSAGSERGMYFMPQVDDEVLVAFHHGDDRDVFVIGSLWNQMDAPPATQLGDPVNKRIIRTPEGHEIVFDDARKSISVTNIDEHRVTLERDKIDMTTSGQEASVTLEANGRVTIKASQSLKVEAPTIEIEGRTITIKSNNSISLTGGTVCDIQASTVNIN